MSSAHDDILDLVGKIVPSEHAKQYRGIVERQLSAYTRELADVAEAVAMRLHRTGDVTESNGAYAVMEELLRLAPAPEPTRDFHGGLLVTAVRLAASHGWRTISVRRLLRLMEGDRRYLPMGRR